MDVDNATLTNADLSGVALANAFLIGANLRNVDLDDDTLTTAQIVNTTLANVSLADADQRILIFAIMI